MGRQTTCLCIVLAVSGAVWAGDLTPFADSANPSPYQRMYARGEGFTEPAAEAGAVSENATVVKFTNGSSVIHGMIDSSKPDAPAPDVLRLDFTGKGTFADRKLVVPLTLRQQGKSKDDKIFQATFGPATLQAEVDGRTVPVAVRGMYYKRGTSRSAYLMTSTGAKGECAFGGKTFPVQLTDNTGNLRLTDSPSVKLANGKVQWGSRPGMVNGDVIQIDTGDGNTVTAHYGQPVLVAGTWYDVTVSKNGKKVSAKLLKLKTGTIRCGEKKWSAMLIGEKYVLNLSSQGGAVAVPTGTYALANYSEGGEGRSQLTCGRREMYTGKTKMIDVAGGKAMSLSAGSPLQATVAVSVRKGQVRMNLAMTDAAGMSVDSVTTAKGGRPPAPEVEIFDTSGASVYKAKLAYG